jgi:16S rRNA (guanine527-N7)-methyltransferase
MRSMDPAVLLRDGLAQLEIAAPERAQGLLEKYVTELERWNPRFGLVKYDSGAELIVKHVLDSLSAWAALRAAASSAGTVLDVGSGAGFPGIPLAIVLPGLSFTLLERMTRRAAFLETCAILLGLSRVKVARGDLAEMTGDFDVVTFRAVAPLGRFLEDLESSAIRWRTILAYKGRHERAREEIEEAARRTKGRIRFELRPLHTPFLEEERCLAISRPVSLLTND